MLRTPKPAGPLAAIIALNLVVLVVAIYAQWQWLKDEQLEQVGIPLRTVAEERSKQIDSWRVGIERLTASAVNTPTIGLFLADVSEASQLAGAGAPLSSGLRDQAEFAARLLSEFNESVGAVSSTLYLNNGMQVVAAGVSPLAGEAVAPLLQKIRASGRGTFAPVSATDKQLFLSLFLPVPAAQYFGQSKPGEGDRSIKLNISLHCGEEWVGFFISNQHVELAVLGDTINQAARLCDFARNGSIWISKSAMSKLTLTERARVIYGVYKDTQDSERIWVDNIFTQIRDRIEHEGSRYDKMMQISNLAVAEISEVAEAEDSDCAAPENGTHG